MGVPGQKVIRMSLLRGGAEYMGEGGDFLESRPW
jgi:hypothetical protein